MGIDKYYCDRCGLEIKNIFSQKKDDEYPELVQNYNRYGEVDDDTYCLYEVYLCDECRKDFYEWWDIK